MTEKQLILWLLEGDVSIQYQVNRDILGANKPELRKRIETEGWGAKLLSCRQPHGHWGGSFYLPKWISSHYSLLDIKNLCVPPSNKLIKKTLDLIFENEKGPDGGINPLGTVKQSDVCVNGMVLNYSSYFGVKQDALKSVIDFLISEHMRDGGFNCQSNKNGAVHSSLHSTLSVMEGILEYQKNGYTYRLDELQKAELDSREFLLIHKLFRSHRNGNIIRPDFLKLHYPPRWRYDILKALDYLQSAGVKYDTRMEDALSILVKKRTKSGQWLLSAKYPGQTHFEMEQAGKPSRWNTLRALRVLNHFGVSVKNL